MSTNQELLEYFIIENELYFKGSMGNADSAILCGYALYIGADLESINEVLKELYTDLNFFDYEEIERIFNYCKNTNYDKWWHKESNREQYNMLKDARKM